MPNSAQLRKSMKELYSYKKNIAKRNMSSAVWASSLCKMFYVKLLSKVVLRQRSSSVKGRLQSKVVFCPRSFSFLGFSPEYGIAQLVPYVVRFICRGSPELVHLNDLHFWSLPRGPPQCRSE